MRHAVLIYNPASGRQRSRRLLPEILRSLADGGFRVVPRPTRGPRDATRLAREAVAQGDVEVVFTMGGDGTLREAAAGLLGSPVALGPLAAGTVNVVALALGLPRSALAAARLLPACAPRPIDVGLAGGEPFLMMASAGLDAAVLAEQRPGLKKYLGRAAFAGAAAWSWLRYPFPELVVREGGRENRATLVVVANVPFYGGSARIAPDADFADGRLDLVLFRGGRAATAGFAADLVRGRHQERADVTIRRVENVVLEGPAETRVQTDGDVLAAALPLTVSIAADKLLVLAP